MVDPPSLKQRMMGLCKTVHTLLGLPGADDRLNPPHRCRKIPSIDGGGLRLLAGDPPKPPNVVESSAVGPAGKPPESVDPGARGLYDRNDDRLGLCTEGLGSESGDERVGMDEAEVEAVAAVAADGRRLRRRGRAISRGRGEGARFPPPLTWLAGRQSMFLRPVRTDGRFVLTEVRIERPEIFRASRQDGRLKLEFIRSEDVRKEEEKENAVAEEKLIGEAPAVAVAVVAEEGEETKARVGGGGEEESSGGWECGLGRSERFSRCQEAVRGNRIPVWWNHHFMMTA